MNHEDVLRCPDVVRVPKVFVLEAQSVIGRLFVIVFKVLRDLQYVVLSVVPV
ncbi:histone H4 [Phytophthora nicotianae P1569]|uniref:Histone H4 n=1 Tax=Phytophthora nicotianae P1569 TaxID=1317065 RepID=V9DTR1_PHYNI|nr:histone H4 [Phytophthora nicotianae P1569]